MTYQQVGGFEIQMQQRARFHTVQPVHTCSGLARDLHLAMETDFKWFVLQYVFNATIGRKFSN